MVIANVVTAASNFTDNGFVIAAGANKTTETSAYLTENAGNGIDITGRTLFSGAVLGFTTDPSIPNDAVVSYSAAQMINGLIVRSGLTVARTDVFPTGATLVAGINGEITGTSFTLNIVNTSAQVLTFDDTAVGCTFNGTQKSIGPNVTMMMHVRITGASTYTIQPLGRVGI